MPAGPPKPHESSQFPPRLCPQCRGREIPCDLCKESRKVSHFLAAVWLSEHPEIRTTPGEFPSVRPPAPRGGQDGGKDGEG